MYRMMIMAAAGFAAAALSVPVAAQQGNWRTIAFKTVNRGTDVDRINVRGHARLS